jgi:phospholipid transport system substrate-binding protein
MRARFAAVLPAMIVAFGLSADELTPLEVVEETASGLQAKLHGNQEFYADNLDQLYAVINDILLPHFDVRLAGRMVLGKHWRPATEDQRDRFIDAFYTFLVKTYAKGMLEFDQDGLMIFADQEPGERKSGCHPDRIAIRRRYARGSELQSSQIVKGLESL